MGKECLNYHSGLTELIAIKKGEDYTKTIIETSKNLFCTSEIRTDFPASRLLSRRGKMKREKRPLLASDELSDEAADQTSGRNLPVFKTGFV